MRPWQTESYKECQEDLEKHAKKRGVSLDRPWRELSLAERAWVIDGEGPWEKGHWYGIKRYFEWLETRAYKMHVRVLLSRYRAYTPCDACNGARLRTTDCCGGSAVGRWPRPRWRAGRGSCRRA